MATIQNLGELQRTTTNLGTLENLREENCTIPLRDPQRFAENLAEPERTLENLRTYPELLREHWANLCERWRASVILSETSANQCQGTLEYRRKPQGTVANAGVPQRPHGELEQTLSNSSGPWRTSADLLEPQRTQGDLGETLKNLEELWRT